MTPDPESPSRQTLTFSAVAPEWRSAVKRLHRLSVGGRWLLVLCLWATVGTWSLLRLGQEIALWVDYFTWTAVRYGLVFHRLSALGLALCLGFTLATLIWQSRNILWGIPRREQKRLENAVERIHLIGERHPLWRWVIRAAPTPPSASSHRKP